jgi:hypothetical protein
MSAASARGDREQAALLLEEAETHHHGDSALAAAVAKCKVIVRRAQWLDSALDAMRHDLAEDRFASAVGHFREALGLSRGLPLLKSRVDQQAERRAAELLPDNWRIAETLLHEAAITEPPLSPAAELTEKIQQARQEELIIVALHKADRLELEGHPAEARQKLIELLAANPSETRISDRIYALDHPTVTPPELVVKIEASQLPVLKASQPSDSELDTEGSLNDPAYEFSRPGRTKFVISNAALDAIKNFAALAATTTMLGTAGILVWQHFSQPVRPAHVRHRDTSSTAITTVPVTQPPPPDVNADAKTSKSAFEDVPQPASDQEAVLQAVRNSGRPTGAEVVDELAIKGNQATVRYRPKDSGSGAPITFSLIRQGTTWQVQSVR